MFRIALMLVLFGCWVNTGLAAPLAIPDPLQPWRAWVLHDHPEVTCPFLYNDPTRSCVWPSELSLDLGPTGGRFVLQVDVFAEQWVPLPGGDGQWPSEVKLAGGDSLAVVRRSDRPAVFLPAGRHSLSGVWSWAQLPRQLPVPENFGLLRLLLNGVAVAQPAFNGPGSLWLSVEQNQEQKAERDSVSVKVFRKVTDSNPLLVETRVQLNVSGKERELLMGPMLLPGFVPRDLRGDLPARIEADGRLRVQIKAGVWEISASAHHQHDITQLSYEPQGDDWPVQEVWVFVAQPSLRTTQVEGVPAIDASQTPLPHDWQNLPTYLVLPKETVTIKVLHRGDPNPSANQLSLRKVLWLDFDGAGFTVKDQLSGTLHQGWRLEVGEGYELGRAELNGEPQLLTRLVDDGQPGVEVRQRQVDLTAVSRLVAAGTVPVSGWQSDFEQVSATLHLPPGWSLLHLTGADSVYGGWLSAWTLWDIFLVLVLAVSIGRVTDLRLGLLALVTLTLIYQRADAPLFIWLNLIIALALLPYVEGRLRAWLGRYLIASFALLLLIMLPFMVQQARQAVYPQLDLSGSMDFGLIQTRYKTMDDDGAGAPAMEMKTEMIADQANEVSVSSVSPAVLSKVRSPSPRQQYVPEYDPSQKIQVGPGLPTWSWRDASAEWSGPVQAGETTRLILASPLLNRLGSALSVLLVLSLGAGLMLHFMQRFPQDWLRKAKTFSSAAAVLVLVAMIPAPDASAQVNIDKDLLKELERRLLQPPQCQPDCVALESVLLTSSDDGLRIVMNVHSAADLAIQLPAHLQQWWPASVTVDGNSAAAIQNRGGPLFVRLTSGRHQVVLVGPAPAQDSFSLSFGLPLQNVNTQLNGWRVSGLPSLNQSSQTLQLQREQQSVRTAEQNRLLPDPIPPYVVVTRRIQLGLEWTVSTEVQRIAPAQGVINLGIPLLPGEAPNSGERNADGTMDVRFAPDQQVVQWQSSLKVQSPIELVAPKSVSSAEVWVLHTSPIWHSQFSGLQPIASQGEQVLPMWQPWPGESVTVTIQRPQPIAGEQLAIDDINLQQQIGKRSSITDLTLTLRASYGGPFELPIPADAELKQVLLDGVPTPISHSENRLQIPVRPGQQTIGVQWQQNEGTQFLKRTPALNLNQPSTNIHLHMSLPSDRWLLVVGGPLLGPAVLFWGMLAVVLLLIAGLVRSRLTPLKTYQWLLLSLGIATFNLYILALVAAWFVLLQLRGKASAAMNPGRFNTMQVLLFVLSVASLGALISSIPYSLLASPEMMIVGNGSSATYLQWYQDQAGPELPQGWVISLPMMVYRMVMLVWSLWLAFALTGWIRWAWQQLGVNGYWLSPPPTIASTVNAVDSIRAGPEVEQGPAETTDESNPPEPK